MDDGDKVVVLACVPCDGELARAVGLHYMPGPDYVRDRCQHCQAEVWVGPTQMAFYRSGPARALLLCIPCALVARPVARPVAMDPHARSQVFDLGPLG